jgi:hypothetical protein
MSQTNLVVAPGGVDRRTCQVSTRRLMPGMEIATVLSKRPGRQHPYLSALRRASSPGRLSLMPLAVSRYYCAGNAGGQQRVTLNHEMELRVC